MGFGVSPVGQLNDVDVYRHHFEKNLEFQNSIFTDQDDPVANFNFTLTNLVTTGLCAEKLEFESAPNMNVLMKPNGNDYPKDMNFTGNMEVLLNPDGVSNAQNLNVFCVPSGYSLDETNFGDSGVINNADLNGFPSEFGSDLQEVKNQFFQIEIGDLGIPEGLFSFEIDSLDQYINFIFAYS